MDDKEVVPAKNGSEMVLDSDDSVDSLKNSPNNRNKLKKSTNVIYARNTLRAGKVRSYTYHLRNVGTLNLGSWDREDAEKDPNLYTSSSNFKRESSKRRIKETNYSHP